MAVLTVKDFKDIQDMVMEELKYQASDTTSRDRIKRDINAIYLNEVVPQKRWWWLSGRTDLQHRAAVSDGTAATTPDSTAVTLSFAPTTSKAGQLFALQTFAEIYEIAAHTANSTSLTLSTQFNGNLETTASYTIWSDSLQLPADCRETVEVTHDFMKTPMKGVGLQEFRRIVSEDPRRRGKPLYYTTYDFFDPTPNDDETESDRVRLMKIYPAINDGNITIHVDYTKEADGLDTDGDEPLMPVEDRMVLVYGALSRAWARERNPEEAARNRQLFESKLARMVGRTEDSRDTPRMTLASRYMAQKRGPRLGRSRGLDQLGGNSFSSPNFLKDVTIEGAVVTAAVTVSTGITIDGRDISVDGAALDSHISASSGVHGVSGALVGASESQTLTNKTIDAASNTITNIDNAAISASAAIALTKLATLTASRALVSDASGVITVSTATSTELGHLSGVTSAIQTQLDAKRNTADSIALGDLAALTASRALVTNGSGEITAATTTAAELGYLSGVTSALQTQLDGKVDEVTGTDNAIVRFSTGNAIQNSGVLIDDNNNLDVPGTLLVDVGGSATIDPALALDVTGTTTLASKPAPSLTETQRDAVSSPPAGAMAYNSTSNKYNYFDGTAWAELGSGGSGGKNYFDGGNFESGVGPATTYDDTSAYVDGTGGSPAAITVAQNTTTPLAGSADLSITKAASDASGEGVTFTSRSIDRADRGRNLFVTFEWDGTDSNYTDSDYQLKAYDVADGIELTVYAIAGLNSDGSLPATKTKVLAFVQTSAATTGSIRMSLHMESDSQTGQSHVCNIDDLSLSPSSTVPGVFSSAPTTWTPTGSWTTNTTYSGLRWRVADREFYSVKVTLSGAPNSTQLLLNLPSGITIDSSKIVDAAADGDILGQVSYLDQNVGARGSGLVVYESTSQVNFRIERVSSNNDIVEITQAVPQTWASGDALWAVFSVPVEGWEATAALSTAEAGLQTEKLSAESAVKTPGASLDFMQMTNNSVELKQGRTYLLTGQGDFDNNGSNPAYVFSNLFWTTANGADNGSQPTLITADADLEVTGFPTATESSPSISSLQSTAQTVVVKALTDKTIFLVPRAGLTTAANARVTVFLQATALPDFSVFSTVAEPITAQNIFNYAQNGEFRFFQRQTPGTLTNRQDDEYGPDRWYILNSGGAVNTQVARVSESPSQSPTPYSCQVRQADSTARRFGIAQILESDRVIPLRGKRVTFSFWARTDGLEVSNLRAGIVEWTGTADSVTSDFVSSWADTPTLIANASFANTPSSFPMGGAFAQFQVTANLGNSFNNLALFVWSVAEEAQNDDFYISQTQLVEGSNALPWTSIRREYAEDLVECQRMYEKSYTIDTAPGTNTTEGMNHFRLNNVANNAHAIRTMIDFAAGKRIANVSLSVWKPDGTANFWGDVANNNVTISKVANGIHRIGVEGTVGTTTDPLIQGQWAVEAEL